jgi:hypothetical protein
MNGEGIMALPQDMGMGQAPGGGIDDLSPFIQAQNALKEVGTNRFSRELLSAGAELDSAEVAAFLDEIRAAGLSQEDREVILEVLSRVKEDVQNYPRVRKELLDEGYPEDLLPPTFDPEFFVALEIAMEADVTMEQGADARAMGPEIQGFAEGGIVSLNPVAKALQDMGRGGDTILAHINPQEAALLKRMGGSGTINPYTGLREYKIGRALSKAWKAVTKPIRAVGKAVKKFAKSTVGRVVLTIAIGAFLGPAAASMLSVTSVAGVAAVSAGIGAFGASIAAGDKFKDALRAGVTSAAVAGLGTAAYGGFTGTDVTSAGTYTGPTTVSGTADAYKAKVDSLLNTAPTGAEAVTAPGTAGTATQQLGAEAVSATQPIDMTVGPGIESTSYTPPGTPVAPPVAPVESAVTPQAISSPVAPPTAPQTTPLSSQFDPNVIDPGAPNYVSTPVSGTPATPLSDLQPQYGEPGFVNQYPTTQAAGQAAGEPGLFSRTFSPSTRADIATQEAIAKAQTLYPNNPAAQEMFLKANAPGVFTKYGPLTAAGLGATYLLGGMEAKPAEDPGLIDQGYTGEDYLRENADQFGQIAMPQTYSYQSLVPTPSDFGRTAVSSPGTIVPTGITALPTARALVQEYNRSGMYGVPEIYRAKKGSSPEGVTNFPRKTGPINGPGTGTSDSIPAMLSDGEFVFTAKAVRNMGNGSRRKGAARMYKMMKMLEGGPVGMASKKG